MRSRQVLVICLGLCFGGLWSSFFFLGEYVGKRQGMRALVAEPHQRWNTGDILALLDRQAADWNRGDLDAFAAGYKNSPDILFIGSRTSRGYDGMLTGYKQHYATRDAMGKLTFTDQEVQPLDARFATVYGHYHLQRSAAGGGNADGYFLLVLENTPSGWKIVRDDTTSLPKADVGR